MRVSSMFPGKPNKIDLQEGWTLENEIEWTEWYIKEHEKIIIYQTNRLVKLYSARAWWKRFILYCNKIN